MEGDHVKAVRAATDRRAIWLFAAGGLVSSFGDGAATTALAYIVYQRTHSAFLLSIVYLVAFGIVGFLTPLAGWLADRVDRRRLIIAGEAGSAVCFAAVALADSTPVMLALVFVASLVAAPIWPAFAAAVPNLVTEHDLPWANGVLSATSTIGRTAGPMIGGLLIPAVGGPGVFLLDAVTFAVIAVCVALATGDYQGAGASAHSADAHGLWAGFHHIAGDRMLLSITAAWTLMFLSMDMAWVGDAPLAEQLRMGSLGFGLISTLFGVGAVLGGVAGRWLRGRDEPAALLSGTFGVTAGFALVGLAPWFTAVLAGQTVSAFVDTLGAVAGMSLLQRTTPDRIRGRVFGAIGAAGMIMNVPAFLLGGVLVGAVGPRAVYGIGAGIAVVAGIVMLPGVTALRRGLRAEAVAVRTPGTDATGG